MQPYQRYLEKPPRTREERIALCLEAIRLSTERRPEETVNQSNVRHMEAFFAFLRESFPGASFRAEVQPIPGALVRTTDRNFVVTVPGVSTECIVLVAHYDTWAGFSRDAPGADDNTTGEEILKQYLLQDLRARNPPPLTHVYLFAGSEECGTRGLFSQFGLTVGLSLVAFALSSSSLVYLLAALPFAPLAVYRFGVTGTRHYVRSLSPPEKSAIRAAIAVDSVGEGRLYIPENEMGANFLRALWPYEGSEPLNDLLEEAAHLNHIKYNRFLGGGTTDSVAFLEEGRIPAAALITMSPGKCSPFVLGGKLHTARDTPERVYAEPLGEVLTLLDYAFHTLEGGERPSRPRALSEHHYARLYRDAQGLLLAMKDSVEPNRRNINSVFRVEGELQDGRARLKAKELLWWGVETSLDKEVGDFRPGARRVPVRSVEVTDERETVAFELPTGVARRISAAVSRAVGALESLMGRYSFLAMLLTALVVSAGSTAALEAAALRVSFLANLLVDHFAMTVVGLLAFQLSALFRLFTRDLPTWMDNAYRHQNRACNLGSLRRRAGSAHRSSGT